MAMLILNFLLLVLSTCVFLWPCSEAQIYIEPTEGKRCPQNASCPNITAFGKMADSFSNSSDVIVYFLEGTHLLDLPELVIFRNLNNAVFVGKADGNIKMKQGFHETVWQSTVVIKCTQSGGLAFVNSSNVTFKSITITNCGANVLDLNETVTGGHLCNATLLFFRVTNITIDHASVQNGSGYGVLVATDGFEITITSSSFAQNSASCESGCSGGNVILFYIDPPFGSEINQTHKTHITATNISLGMGGEHANCSGFLPGGGLAIYMEHTQYKMEVFIDRVIAFGTIGGSNIEIITTPHLLPYSFTINNTVCSHAQHQQGGGLYFHNGWQSETGTSSNSIGHTNFTIINSKFTDNSANLGGGLLIKLNKRGYSLTVSIETTEINNNIADIGSGLYFTQSVYNTLDIQWNVIFSNITVNNNTNNQSGKYNSAIYASSVTLLKLNNVRITNNNSTGLLAINTKVLVGNNSDSLFSNNSGVDGGGLFISADSYLTLGADAQLDFINNRAAKRGGAIFVHEIYHPLFKYCFFQYIDPNLFHSARIYFSGNIADEAGSVLYGGNIDQCELLVSKLDSGQIFNITFNYSDQTGTSVVSSDPSQVCFCQNDVPNCSIETLNMAAYPGEKIIVQVVTLGQRNGVVPAIIWLQGAYNTPALSSQPYSTHTLQCKNISIKVPHTGNEQLINSIVLPGSNKKWLNITVLECSLGFSVSTATGTCDCVELKHQNLSITCDSTTQKIQSKVDHWIGFDPTNNCTVVIQCPFNYCGKSEVSFTLNDSDPQCELNRAGTLCGSCRPGLSLSLGSNNCIDCHDYSGIALILPIAAAGFGLVALLMVLNLTVSAGTLNGLIFYANIVKVSEDIFFSYDSIPVLSQFISWLNLDFGFETCFFIGMTAYAKVWLQFVFPLFIWGIIATIIVLCRYSTWLTNKTGDNIVQVLATLILLSYTKLFRAIMFVLKWTDLTCISGGKTRSVWSMDGNVDYLKTWREVILFIAALLFLFLAVSYTLVLLFNVLIDKYLTKIKFFRKWWMKFKPLCDAYNGPYKDGCRFWTGMLLLARLGFVLVASFSGDTQVATTTISVLLLSLVVAFGGIYQKKHLNILECWSLLNLAVLSSLVTTSWLEEAEVKISVSLMLVTFIGVLFYHIFLRLNGVKYVKKFIKSYKHRKINKRKELQKEEDNSSKLEINSTPIEMCMKRESLLNEP